MADAKYGRLFTEMDLKLVATEAAAQLLVRLNRVGEARYETPPTKDELVAVVEDAIANEDAAAALTFPADEPLFLLRASEPGAVTVMAAIYNSDEFNDGAGYVRSSEHYRDLVKQQFAFMDWQDANPDRVKVPD